MAVSSLRYSAYSAGLAETVTDRTISANICTFNFSDGSIGYISTAPGANFTVNVTNVPAIAGTSLTITLFVVQGATGYIPNALQIDGAAQTIKWASGTAPTPTNGAGKIDIFTFTMIRRGSSWTVFGSAVINF